MRKKEILKKCEIIMASFDAWTNVHYLIKEKQANEFVDLCDKVSGFSEKMESIAPELAENFTVYYSEFMNALNVAFGFGYALGQSFDSPYPQTREAVESIKKVIRERALLPHFPREKAA